MTEFIHRLSGPQVSQIIDDLGANNSSFARDVGVNRRTVQRWRSGGVAGCDAHLMCMISQAHAEGRPWRKEPAK